jgi:hypothetical protein
MAYTTIDNPELYFQTKLYTGNGSTQSITLDGDEDMQPDFLWIKDRDNATSHQLVDVVRGSDEVLCADENYALTTDSNRVSSLDADGFSVGSNSNVNTDTANIVSWCWKESATAGFDIVGYTGNGTDDTDIAHSLSAVPHVIIVKNRTEAYGWNVYHHKNTSAPETDVLSLDTNAATYDTANSWSDEAPTSSVFTLGSGNGVNKDTNALIAYLWTDIQGFSKFGSYSGNGNADGAFIYTGFKPAFTIIKRTDTTNNWMIGDNKITPYNPLDGMMRADIANAELSTNPVDYLSNGFKIRLLGNAFNNSSGTYVYMAFAEAPFVNSNGVPCNAR